MSKPSGLSTCLSKAELLDGNRMTVTAIDFGWSDTIRSNTFREYREALYIYHRKGLDLMTKNLLEAKNNIISALLPLKIF